MGGGDHRSPLSPVLAAVHPQAIAVTKYKRSGNLELLALNFAIRLLVRPYLVRQFGPVQKHNTEGGPTLKVSRHPSRTGINRELVLRPFGVPIIQGMLLLWSRISSRARRIGYAY